MIHSVSELNSTTTRITVLMNQCGERLKGFILQIHPKKTHTQSPRIIALLFYQKNYFFGFTINKLANEFQGKSVSGMCYGFEKEKAFCSTNCRLKLGSSDGI